MWAFALDEDKSRIRDYAPTIHVLRVWITKVRLRLHVLAAGLDLPQGQ